MKELKLPVQSYLALFCACVITVFNYMIKYYLFHSTTYQVKHKTRKEWCCLLSKKQTLYLLIVWVWPSVLLTAATRLLCFMGLPWPHKSVLPSQNSWIATWSGHASFWPHPLTWRLQALGCFGAISATPGSFWESFKARSWFYTIYASP